MPPLTRANHRALRREAVSASPAETGAIAQEIAHRLRCGDVVTLRGNLGAGKTTFAQALIQALSPEPVEVTSPTYTLLQPYAVRLPGGEACELAHIDLYRIESAREIDALALEEYAQGICLIEWPQRLGDYPLTVTLEVTLEMRGQDLRALTLDSRDPYWLEQWA